MLWIFDLSYGYFSESDILRDIYLVFINDLLRSLDCCPYSILLLLFVIFSYLVNFEDFLHRLIAEKVRGVDELVFG